MERRPIGRSVSCLHSETMPIVFTILSRFTLYSSGLIVRSMYLLRSAISSFVLILSTAHKVDITNTIFATVC